jgi:hypothetical protein
MTAVRNQTTLNRLAATEDVVSFIHRHGDKLGEICTISDDGAQVTAHSWDPQDATVAGSLIAWFYLIDNAKVRAFEATVDTRKYAHVTIYGQINGRPTKVYTGLYDNSTVAYVLSRPEVTVHALRRVQVGDVPAVDTKATQS